MDRRSGASSSLTPFLALISTRFRMALQYRAAAAAGMATQVFFGILMVMVLRAFYASSTAVMPMTLPEAMTYIWLGQAFLGMLPWSLDRQLTAEITGGNIAYLLVKPLGIYTQWFARSLAERMARVTLRALPLLIVVTWVLPLTGMSGWSLVWPDSPLRLMLWFVSLASALVLGTAFLTLMHTSLLWTISGNGLGAFVMPVVTIFSGMVIPLPLFPDSLQKLLLLLPFSGLVDIPNRIFSGNLSRQSALAALALQSGWIVIFIVFGKLLMIRGMRKLVIQGG